MKNLRVTYRPIAELKPYQRNARTHSKKQIRKIAASIKQFGFTNPVLIDGEGRIMAGHGRVKAAELLSLSEVPTIRLEHLSEAEKQAYILADNPPHVKTVNVSDRKFFISPFDALNEKYHPCKYCEPMAGWE